MFVIGAGMHFAYALLGENLLVGLIAPVNESIWEHTKLAFWPMLVWWVAYLLCRGKRYAIDANRWLTAAVCAITTAVVAIPTLYYLYTGALGISVTWVDACILLVAIALGHAIGLHLLRRAKGINAKVAVMLLAVWAILFILITCFPPHLPLFEDPLTATYGIPAL